jgi:hypothetical protein
MRPPAPPRRVHRNAPAQDHQYNQKDQTGSIALPALQFSEGTVFPDARLVGLIVDRITFNAHILETGTESYRLRTGKTSRRRKRAS